MPSSRPGDTSTAARWSGARVNPPTRSGVSWGVFFRLLFLFTMVPLIELALLVLIDRQIGLASTLALVIATAILGAWLARSQGVRVLARLNRELAEGRVPAEPLLDGLMIFVAGAVLLTPGLLTDLFGFFLLTPAGRGLVRRAVSHRLKQRFAPVEPGVIVIEQD